MSCVEGTRVSYAKRTPHQTIHNNHKYQYIYFDLQNINNIRLDLSTENLFIVKSFLKCEYNLNSLRSDVIYNTMNWKISPKYHVKTRMYTQVE